MPLLEMRPWLDERLCAPAKLLRGGDALDLDEGSFREGLDGEGAAGRERGFEELGIDSVHRGEIIHVSEEYGGLQDFVEVGASLFKDRLEIGQGLTGLGLHSPFRERTGGRIDRKLAGNEDETVMLDGLAVRADGGRSLFCAYLSHKIKFLPNLGN